MSAVPVSPGPVGFIQPFNVDPVLNLGPLPIHWYGVMYAVAFLAAYQFGVLPYAKRRGLPKGDRREDLRLDDHLRAASVAVLYYVVQQPDLWQNYILHPNQHHRLLAGWDGLLRRHHRRLHHPRHLRVAATDTTPGSRSTAVLSSAVVGQPIGRIGNVINGDILGAPSNLPWATAYSNPHAILQTGFSLCNPGAVHRISAGCGVRGARDHRHWLILWLAVSPECASGRGFAVTYVALYAISQLILFRVPQRAENRPDPRAA